MINNQQPEVNSLQGGGEMFKTCFYGNESCKKLARLTQSPPADINKIKTKDEK